MSDHEEAWLRVEVLVDNIEVYSDRLLAAGAMGVEIQDKETFMEDGSMPPLPEGKNRIIAFFPQETPPEELEASLREQLYLAKEDIYVSLFTDQSWKTAWQEYFKPVRLSRRAVVGPPWETFDPPTEWVNRDGETEAIEDGIKIIINPGLAFGTGTHETTQLAASFLDDMILAKEEEGNPYSSLLDVGCGSGILSILAYLLGIPDVRGIDVDVDAIQTANETLEEYHLTDIHLSTLPIAEIEQTYPIVVANILGHILLTLREELARVTAVGGKLIISGVLATEADAFSQLFCSQLFKEVFREEKGEWVAYIFQRI